MNIVTQQFTPEQYKALYEAQLVGVRFDCYLLAPGERVWKSDLPLIDDSKLPNTMPDRLMKHIDPYSIIRAPSAMWCETPSVSLSQQLQQETNRRTPQ